jgi:hypothetical protein
MVFPSKLLVFLAGQVRSHVLPGVAATRSTFSPSHASEMSGGSWQVHVRQSRWFMDRVDGIVQDHNQEESGVTLREKHVLHVAMTIPGFFQAAEAILKSGGTEDGSGFFNLHHSYGVLPTLGISSTWRLNDQPCWKSGAVKVGPALKPAPFSVDQPAWILIVQSFLPRRPQSILEHRLPESHSHR